MTITKKSIAGATDHQQTASSIFRTAAKKATAETNGTTYTVRLVEGWTITSVVKADSIVTRVTNEKGRLVSEGRNVTFYPKRGSIAASVARAAKFVNEWAEYVGYAPVAKRTVAKRATKPVVKAPTAKKATPVRKTSTPKVAAPAPTPSGKTRWVVQHGVARKVVDGVTTTTSAPKRDANSVAQEIADAVKGKRDTLGIGVGSLVRVDGTKFTWSVHPNLIEVALRQADGTPIDTYTHNATSVAAVAAVVRWIEKVAKANPTSHPVPTTTEGSDTVAKGGKKVVRRRVGKVAAPKVETPAKAPRKASTRTVSTVSEQDKKVERLNDAMRAIFDGLRDAGLSPVVLDPGGRSTNALLSVDARNGGAESIYVAQVDGTFEVCIRDRAQRGSKRHVVNIKQTPTRSAKQVVRSVSGLIGTKAVTTVTSTINVKDIGGTKVSYFGEGLSPKTKDVEKVIASFLEGTKVDAITYAGVSRRRSDSESLVLMSKAVGDLSVRVSVPLSGEPADKEVTVFVQDDRTGKQYGARKVRGITGSKSIFGKMFTAITKSKGNADTYEAKFVVA